MGDMTGDGELTPELVFEMNRVEGSRKSYWDETLEQSKELNKNFLLCGALEEKGVKYNWRKDAFYIPIEDCTRGFHRATDVLIYRRDEFGQILFGVDKKIDLEKFMTGTSALTDPHQLEVRPFLRSPEVGKVKQPIDVLLRAYWGWYSQRNVMGKDEPIAEVWKYEPQIDSSNGISYLRFYSKRGDWREGTFGKLLEKPLATRSMVKVGWVYFPVEQQYAKTLDTTIQESIKSIGLLR